MGEVGEGREKRRKKQAVRRMEQILRSHGEEGVRTLDREEQVVVREEGRVRRQHKRSILKQEGRRREEAVVEDRSKGGGGAKVKFAGSLHRKGGRERRRVVVRGPTYLLHLPWGYQALPHPPHLVHHGGHQVHHGAHQPQHMYDLQLHQRL